MNNIDSSTSPLVSIVTVVRNAAKEIAKTFSSIRSIKNEYVEYIVIDGNSTDGTQEVAAQYADTIDVFLSEPDKGIYDAMNKASKLARGHYILNINAGDTLLYFTLRHSTKRCNLTSGCSMRLCQNRERNCCSFMESAVEVLQHAPSSRMFLQSPTPFDASIQSELPNFCGFRCKSKTFSTQSQNSYH